jgi:hypothetical protein
MPSSYGFDYAEERPGHIDQILNGLDRYNPETTSIFQDYVMEQCEKRTYDIYANLALLKLYVKPFLLRTRLGSKPKEYCMRRLL